MLVFTLILLILSSLMILLINTSSYIPRQTKDTFLYTQAQILASDSKELAKYFLYETRKAQKECLDFVEFHYPNANDKIKISYFYPLAECKNFKLVNLNTDANLSKDFSIIVNVSVLLNTDTAVNEEIFISKNFVIYPNFTQGFKP